MKKVVYKVAMEQKHEGGYLRIMSDLFTLRVPSKEGGLRFLTASEIFVLSYLMQAPIVTINEVARKLNLSSQAAHRAVCELKRANLVKREEVSV